MQGVESPWEKAGSLVIVSGRLFVGDALLAPDDPAIVVDLPPGTYDIDIRRIDFEGDTRCIMRRLSSPNGTCHRPATFGCSSVGRCDTTCATP